MILSAVIRRVRKEWQIILLVFSLCSIYFFFKTFDMPSLKRHKKYNQRSQPVIKPVKKDKWVYKPGKVYPPEWYQIPKVLDPQCKPKQNFYFLRTHQTGTSSVTNIFYRYGQEHNLGFVMYPLKLHLNYPGRMNMEYLEDFKPKGGYNIMCQYTRHHKMDVLRVLPDGAIFTSLLRHPVDQFLSVFHNHDIKKEVRNLQNHQNAYEEFFRNPRKTALMASDRVYHLLQNSMSFDLGLSTIQFKNETAVDEFIASVDSDFHLIMILELLDESLVLFKRLMCWDFNQILYVKLSLNNDFSASITEGIREKILDWNSVDLKLYNHFHEKLKKIIADQDDSFDEEVALLKKLNAEFWKECYGNVLPVFHGNKIGHTLQESHSKNMTCKTLATDDVTQTHVIGMKQYKELLPPSDVLMVRNHMQNLRKHNPAMISWSDVHKVLLPEDPKSDKNSEL